jgi:hypothetical protein
MIISGMWFGAEKSWEPVTVLLFSLASFITSDIIISKTPNKHDFELFNAFQKTLPSDGSIKFIDEFNMAGFPFEFCNLDQLTEFAKKWNTPEYKFLDKKLEKIRKNLYEKVCEYLSYLARNTWLSAKNIEYSSVPPEWEIEQPDRFEEVVNKLHDSAGEIVKIHKELISLGIKKGLKNYDKSLNQ